MRVPRHRSETITRLDMIKDGHEIMLEKEGSDKFDLLLSPIGFSHLADEKGLFA
jgi:hypothetical protein